jgi:hypothetical protein
VCSLLALLVRSYFDDFRFLLLLETTLLQLWACTDPITYSEVRGPLVGGGTAFRSDPECLLSSPSCSSNFWGAYLLSYARRCSRKMPSDSGARTDKGAGGALQ